MNIHPAADYRMRLELFVHDIVRARDFYERVLGFQGETGQDDGYTALHNGAVRLALNRLDGLAADHPVQAHPHERLGRGVELVLMTADLQALYRHVCTQGWPLAAPLQQRPWGLFDFRLVDPDGYYWRITEQRT